MNCIEAQIKHAELQALWHIAAANNGTAEMRMVYKGVGKNAVLMTPEQLRKESMDTAQRHILNIMELATKL